MQNVSREIVGQLNKNNITGLMLNNLFLRSVKGSKCLLI